MTAVTSYAGDMRFVARAILPTYMAALQDALEEVARRLPTGRTRRLLAGLRQRLGSRAGRSSRRMRSLHRLAMMGEAEGWLTADESITIRKLAYRCAFYLGRAEDTD